MSSDMRPDSVILKGEHKELNEKYRRAMVKINKLEGRIRIYKHAHKIIMDAITVVEDE